MANCFLEIMHAKTNPQQKMEKLKKTKVSFKKK